MDGVNGVRTSYGTTLNAPDSTAKALDGGSGSTSNVQAKTSTGTADTAKLSSLAQLLSDAATRAAARDASTDRRTLAAIASRATDVFYDTNTKSARDAQVPDSEDPQRLQQARQATDFTNGKGANPFKGLSLEQLTLIAYDEGDAFTVNERRAAWEAAYDERQVWSNAVVKQLTDEYNRTGHYSPDTLRGILDYYRDLPPILEARLPEDYEANMAKKIETAEREQAQSKDEFQSLLDLLLALQQDRKDQASAPDA